MPRIRTAGVIATTSALALALSGCSVLTAFEPHVDSAIWDTAKEMKASNTALFGSPTFVPDDATVIRVDYDTQNGSAIMTYTSHTRVAPNTCQKDTAIPKPAIEDSWWPVQGIPDKASDCGGGWVAFAVGDQVWAAKAPTSK
ncbi:hypothetical protein [Leifsonia sp. 1010]|uniref:hypothetical protein n=1 Tax=Leifsonia sp. 1010 TaxID=2817769 RepID=UPI00285E80C1|nr:hypothetical protein [Leifsonia sp. 1010]MDR6613971.1 hypothetical protein [Leifsonia sp. 1010]